MIMDNDGIPPFNPLPKETSANRWEIWQERFDNFLQSEGITTDTRRRSKLLHYTGEDVFVINRNLSHIADDTYNRLKTKLGDHFNSFRNVEYEVFQFRQAAQGEETIDEFHTRLRGMVKHCEFHDNEREIKSQIIQKCKYPKVRDKGLAMPDISLTDLVKYGRNSELTNTCGNDMSGATAKQPSSVVHKVSAEASTSRPDVSRPSFNRYPQAQRLGSSSSPRRCSGCGRWPTTSSEFAGANDRPRVNTS